MRPTDMDAIAPLVHRLVARWVHGGTTPLEPPNVELLDRLERDPTLRLPADLRAYFGITGGLPDFAWDEEFIAWWSAHRIVPLATLHPKLEEAAGFFVVGDMLMECTHYAIQLGHASRWPHGTVIEGADAEFCVRAPSWTEFVRRRLEEPDRITVWEKGAPVDGPCR